MPQSKQQPALEAEDYAFTLLSAYSAYQWPQYQDAPHHRLICRELEAVERGETTRLIITVPPRHGKSLLASENFPAWYLGRNPDHYVIAATYAQVVALVRDAIAQYSADEQAQILGKTAEGVYLS